MIIKILIGVVIILILLVVVLISALNQVAGITLSFFKAFWR